MTGEEYADEVSQGSRPDGASFFLGMAAAFGLMALQTTVSVKPDAWVYLFFLPMAVGAAAIKFYQNERSRSTNEF